MSLRHCVKSGISASCVVRSSTSLPRCVSKDIFSLTSSCSRPTRPNLLTQSQSLSSCSSWRSHALTLAVSRPPVHHQLVAPLSSSSSSSSSSARSSSSSSLSWWVAGLCVSGLALFCASYQQHSAHAEAEQKRKENQMNVTISAGASTFVTPYDLSSLPVEYAKLTMAPNVPSPITRHHPVLLKVDLITSTLVKQLTPKYKYEYWTFNDIVPGPMIRARVGDVVELSLKNVDESGNPHNIDCHGFEGPGGGASITLAQQGETKTARFKLLYPGLYVYHCAAAPVPAHIMNGMYGLMLIEPDYASLPKVDKEFYVMQSEFYHEPLTDRSNGNTTVEPSYANGLDEKADVVVFNGKEGALTEKPLTAKTGDRIRIYFGNAGPNLTSNFHVIGGIFERVWRDSDFISPPARFLQTVAVPPGGSTVVDMHMLVPGTYTLVDHAIFRLDKGAVGYLNVTGEARPDLYQSLDANPQACVGCKLHP